jgi:tetratricopeptide (TPR) repeat protein
MIPLSVGRWPLAVVLLAGAPALAQAPRIASDFEIQQMERQVAQSRDFLSQLSGHLNLGDLRTARNESTLARAEYVKAREIAEAERREARHASAMTRYATATSYAALADAKLGDTTRSFSLSEEALRYTSDSAKTWNLYASAMTLLRRPAKAASAARNAVAIAKREVEQSPTPSNRLDLAIDQYSLATALLDLLQSAEAERLLRDVVTALRSNEFATVKREIAQNESFEIYSSARGDESAYVSLLNRAQLRLARLYEDRGELERAREQYENVLTARNDDATALGALARLARTPEERERHYAEAFDANPFSLPLIRDYQRFLGEQRAASSGQEETTGGRVRLALQQMQRGELVTASTTIDALLIQFPQNDTLKQLRREIEERRAPTTGHDLRSLLALFRENRLTAEQRAELDRKTFTGIAVFSAPSTPSPAGQTIFESGTIDGIPFRFAEPTAFAGTFATPSRLTYRILGATQLNGADALLLEPVRLEPIR